MKTEISIDIEGDDLYADVEAYPNTAVLHLGDLSINMSIGQFDLLLKEMLKRRLINED